MFSFRCISLCWANLYHALHENNTQGTFICRELYMKRYKKGPGLHSISYSCLFSVVSCACVARRWAVEGSRKCMNHEGMCLCWIEAILTSQRENTHHGPVHQFSLAFFPCIYKVFSLQKRNHCKLYYCCFFFSLHFRILCACIHFLYTYRPLY